MAKFISKKFFSDSLIKLNIILLIISLIIAGFTRKFILYPDSINTFYFVNDNTIKADRIIRVIVNKILYKLTKPAREDLVFYSYVVDESGRENITSGIVLGLPGETIEFENGKFSADGKQIDFKKFHSLNFMENIRNFDSFENTEPIPKNEYLILSEDEREAHVYGTVNIKNFKGKAVLSYWPFKCIKILT